jgi:hypothetical protein
VTSVQREGKTSDCAPRLTWAPIVDGQSFEAVWWPRSRDTATELRALLPAVDGHLGRTVSRVSINLDIWPGSQPRRLVLDGHTVQLGWFGMLDRDTITVGRALGDRVTLLVIPPDTSAEAAGHTIARVTGDAAWTGSATEALAAA